MQRKALSRKRLIQQFQLLPYFEAPSKEIQLALPCPVPKTTAPGACSTPGAAYADLSLGSLTKTFSLAAYCVTTGTALLQLLAPAALIAAMRIQYLVALARPSNVCLPATAATQFVVPSGKLISIENCT